MIASKLALVVLAFSMLGCSYASQDTQLAANSNVGGTGNLKFTHKPLSGSKHLLTVTASPGLGETEGSIQQRLLVFANEFAAKTCPTGFSFQHDPNLDQPGAAGFMARSKSYVFACS